MADRSLRGMRLGAQSLQSEEGVVYSPRSRYTYLCPSCGKETEMVFAAEAEAPDAWECKHCGHEAHLLIDDKPVRTRAELEELLEERLQYLRARRGTSEHKHTA